MICNREEQGNVYMENIFNGMLKQIRKEKGFTQEQLAEAVGVSPQAVSKWEQNGFPDAALLPEIAVFFGITIDELFGRKSENMCFYDRFLKYLAEVPQTERIQRIFELCRLTGASMLGIEEYNEFLFSNIGGYSYTQGTYDSGYLQCRLHSDRPYYLLVPEPEKVMKALCHMMKHLSGSLNYLQRLMRSGLCIFLKPGKAPSSTAKLLSVSSE